MADFSKLKPALVLRRMPRGGHNSSEDINDFIEQTLHDVAGIYNFINQNVIPAFNGLGRSGTWNGVDPITNGIDGSTIMVDRDYADTTSPYFYDSSKNRPKTLYECLVYVANELNEAFIGINEVKSRLGTTDEDSSTASSQATLTELETKVNYLNGLILQTRSANAGYLIASEIASGLSDGTINPATFNIVDVDVSGGAAINPIKLSGVDLTTSYSYGSMPTTYDMRDSVLRLKEWIEDLTGETFSDFTDDNKTPTSDYKTHLMSSGTGAVTTVNPHGMDVVDLTDAAGLLSPALDDLTDVSVSAPTSGYLLSWNGTAWIAVQASGAGGGGGGGGTLSIDTSGQIETRVLISSVVTPVSGGIYDFEVDGYDSVTIDVYGRNTKTGNPAVGCLFFLNGDTTTSNYRGQQMRIDGASSNHNIGDNSWMASLPAGDTTDADWVGWIHAEIPFIAQTTFDKVIRGQTRTRATGDEYISEGAIHWENTAAISGVRVDPDVASSAYFEEGTIIEVWGIKKVWAVTSGTLGTTNIKNGLIVV